MEQDLCCGKTFQELFPQTKEMTLPTFLEQWCKGMFLSLEMDGRTQESVFPKTEDESWNGVCLTHNTSEYRKDAVESSLYSILEHGGGVLRYCLSPKACQGILRRAEERDKTLPKTLKETLERMASMQNGGGYKLVGSLCADDRKGAGNQYVDQGKVVMEKTVCIEGNGSRPSHKGNGINMSDIQYTLNTTEVHAVGYMEKNSEKKDCETLCVQTANTGSNGSNINHDVSATLAKNNTLAVAYRDEHES